VTHRHALRIGVDPEESQSIRGARCDDEAARPGSAGDESLRSVEHEAVAVSACGRGDGRGSTPPTPSCHATHGSPLPSATLGSRRSFSAAFAPCWSKRAANAVATTGSASNPLPSSSAITAISPMPRPRPPLRLRHEDAEPAELGRLPAHGRVVARQRCRVGRAASSCRCARPRSPRRSRAASAFAAHVPRWLCPWS
jgi:hypothetical protein